MANGNNANDAAAATQQQNDEHLFTSDGAICVSIDTAAFVNSTAAPATDGAASIPMPDLWLNGNGNGNGSNSEGGVYGDYANVRATIITTPTTTATAATAAAAVVTTTTQSGGSSSFSFKHFLNSSGTITAPSTTVTSLDAVVATMPLTTASSTNPLQTSTGARPKVPQSASASHMQPTDASSGSGGSSASSKMKRSPRFSSFDSQASLAEYAACGGVGSARIRSDLRLEQDNVDVDALLDADDDDDDDRVGLAQMRQSRLSNTQHERADEDIFPSAASNMQHAATLRYVPRSYSSYDMPPHAADVRPSPRRRLFGGASSGAGSASGCSSAGNREQRPNRLVLNRAPKMKLDLPLDTASNVAGSLPDFVQDHLHDAHLSSPPNSPLGGIGADEDTQAGAVGGASAAANVGLSAAVAAAAGGLPSVASLSALESGQPPSSVKMLPDFLSDGPIIHSSQRLADVAIGLPSNAIDSPPQEVTATALQLSTLRQENERLQRELQESRVELNAQTRRTHELEQQILLLSDTMRRRESLVASANTKATQRYRRHVAQLEAELAALRCGDLEGSADRTGAVGGGDTCERLPTASNSNPLTPGSSVGNNTPRPSRTHQLSRDLLRVSDHAEQHLRQLLSGVDNLRQMAAELQPAAQTAQQSSPAATPSSPDLYTDFH